MQIKFLADQGVSKAAIARRFGISRQTVYNHLNRSEPFLKPRERRGSKLDRFKDYVRARLEKFDLPATVLIGELKQLGYTGGLTILREFVRPSKEEYTRRVTERFETLPGQQSTTPSIPPPGASALATFCETGGGRPRKNWGT